MTSRQRTIRATIAAAVAAALAITTGPTSNAAPPSFRPGAQTRGDSWFPGYGNGGYDALHYGISMRFVPRGFHIAGVTRMEARATQDLSRFSVDLDGLHVHRVVVDGVPARWYRHGHKLVVVPRRGVRNGRVFHVRVRYAGSPRPVGHGPTQTGFLRTDDGAFTVTNDIASDTWFPNNDHPSDKASYWIRVTVPSGLRAISNGRLIHVGTHAGLRSFEWVERSPMASYLATVDIGHWLIRRGRTASGVPELVAVDPKLIGSDPKHPFALRFVYRTTAQVVDAWTRRFGPYPFDSTGGIADYTNIDGKPAGYSEETQTRPVYGSVLDPIDIAHELAHQWFGDSVSITDFSDIWLNEGFATWAAYYWDALNGGTPVSTLVRQQYRQFPASSSYWTHPVAPAFHDPGNFNNGARIYYGGAMALQFLRERVGDGTFFRILRTWTHAYRHANATTADFVRVAERVSGQDLRGFFQQWVYGTGRPPLPG